MRTRGEIPGFFFVDDGTLVLYNNFSYCEGSDFVITVEFGAWCSFGKGDNGETIVAVELSEAEVERLREAAKEWYWDDFVDCEEVGDIYDKVREIAIDQITDELKEYQPGFTDMLGEGEKADSIYYIGVAWPEEMEPDEEEDLEE